MRPESRTTVQIDANRFDADMYRLARRLEDFAKVVKDPHIDEVSRRLFQSRGVVRKHMHKKDREETA